MEEVPRRTLLVPLAFPCFLHCLVRVETAGRLDYQGRAGDHFHCKVEPSPGHIRCRKPRSSPARGYKFEFGCVCSYMAGHEDAGVVTGDIGTNTPKFVPPRWGRPRFDPTQTGLCNSGWVWSSLNCDQKNARLITVVSKVITRNFLNLN